MTSPVAHPRAAERWFLDRGLPSVLTPRGRLRAVWPRSAPALSGFAVVSVCALVKYLLVGSAKVQLDVIDATPVHRVVLTILALALPLSAFVGWLVARMVSDRGQAIASAVSVVIAMACGAIQRDLELLIVTGAVVGGVLALTASGIGSVLGWAARLTLAQLATVGELMVGALPVVLLTVLVFFNTYAWLMAARIAAVRLWLALAVLVVIAVTFIISHLLEHAKPILESATASARHVDRLKGTPFEHMPDPPKPYALTRAERLNEVFILAVTQIALILTVAVFAAGIYLLLGLILLSPEILNEWTHGRVTDTNVLGLIVPVPQALTNMTLFLGALTFMYISARAVRGREYDSKFLDVLIDDLKLTMVARNRYRDIHAGTAPIRLSFRQGRAGGIRQRPGVPSGGGQVTSGTPETQVTSRTPETLAEAGEP